MKSCDVDTILARTQVAIVFVLLGIFGLLLFALLAVLVFSKALGLPDSSYQVVLSLISDMKAILATLSASAVGYFIARQRHKTSNDDDSTFPTQPDNPAK